jgi:putative MATE family efflux protein
MDTDNEKFIQMTTQPIQGLIIKMAIPAILIMMISSAYNLADTYFVSSISLSATAAVGVVYPIMAIIQAIGFFFGQGSGNNISRALGAKDHKQASELAATAFFSSFFIGIILSVLGIFFIEPMCRFLGATDTMLEYTEGYLFYILLGIPFISTSFMLNNLLRFQGSTFYGMIGMVSGAIINIILDPIFIFGLNLGVRGASLATMLSQVVGFSVLLFCCTKKDNIRIKFSDFKPSLPLYAAIVKGGTPSLLRQVFASMSTLILNLAARQYGDITIASFTIANRVIMFITFTVMGFGQGFQPVCGFNYGAKRFDRVHQGFWFCIKVTSTMLLLCSILTFFFSKGVIALFRDDDVQVLELGSRILRSLLIVTPLGGWIVMCNMFFQTIGKSLPASFLALARQGLILIPIILIVNPLFGMDGLILATPISEALTFLISLPMCISILRNMGKEEDVTIIPFTDEQSFDL